MSSFTNSAVLHATRLNIRLIVWLNVVWVLLSLCLLFSCFRVVDLIVVNYIHLRLLPLLRLIYNHLLLHEMIRVPPPPMRNDDKTVIKNLWRTAATKKTKDECCRNKGWFCSSECEPFAIYLPGWLSIHQDLHWRNQISNFVHIYFMLLLQPFNFISQRLCSEFDIVFCSQTLKCFKFLETFLVILTLEKSLTQLITDDSNHILTNHSFQIHNERDKLHVFNAS